MPHALRVALAVCLLLPGPAAAVTIVFPGFLETAVTAGFLDSSVHEGTSVTVTYEVDLTSTDMTNPFSVGTARLMLQFGAYTFDSGPVSGTVAMINDTGVPGSTVDIWQSDAFEVSDLTPGTTPSGSFGGYRAQLQLFDFSSAVFNGSETQPIDPTAPIFSSAWDQVRIEFHSLDSSGNQTSAVHLQAVPEPRSAVLLVLGLAALALRERHRTRVR